MNQNPSPNPIHAAGGLLWRDTPSGRQLLLIHRGRYADWTLPKGKLDPGERWDEAALREVTEETGLHPILGRFAGVTFYYPSPDTPKIVLFWNMTLADGDTGETPTPQNPAEVDAAIWLPVDQAIYRLTYAIERDLLIQAR